MCHQKCTCPQSIWGRLISLPLLLWLISRFAVEVSLLSVRAHRLTATWQTWHSASRTVLMNHSYGWVSRRDSQGIFWAKQSKTAICLLLVQSLENTIVSTFPSIATILSLPYLYNLPWPCTYVLSHTHTHTHTHARAHVHNLAHSLSPSRPLISSFPLSSPSFSPWGSQPQGIHTVYMQKVYPNARCLARDWESGHQYSAWHFLA